MDWISPGVTAGSPGGYLLATLAELHRIVISNLRKSVPFLVLLLVPSVATAGPVAAGGGNWARRPRAVSQSSGSGVPM